MNDPWLGLNSPNRLLRERWKTPTDLAQELYAMLTARGPREINDTLTIRVPEGKPALRVVRERAEAAPSEGGPTFNLRREAPAPGVASSPERARRDRPEFEPPRRPGRPAGDGPEPRRRREEAAARHEDPGRGPAAGYDIEFDASASFTAPVRFDQAVFGREPTILDARTGRPRTLDDLVKEKVSDWRDRTIAGGGPAELLAAVVVDGSGDTYSCHLYTPGADAPKADQHGAPLLATLKILQIDPYETLPRGMAVFPVTRGPEGVYFGQPPIWVGGYVGSIENQAGYG